ncbi:small conductance mechanosensitive channel [Microbacterium halimionae]|uniref:Small conductance mechanosensitive channel n=1 Tax=Microbacterium halimionae TaxID=1526413 RepID=A0A7W3JN58_9MICO|nr:mechanosensitive ion channel domain-containing protein [Microbacterium halimionae]MBA8815946.1 small conductance mechanosensitive channel [Microbacterium halimionae]NII96149.1 small conductance mechanosensitive channel [Microbacterium halimionae]
MNTVALESNEIGSTLWWSDILTALVAVGWNVANVAGIVVGGILLSWVLRIIIHRVVNRIVNRTKNKANVEDTQALDRSPLAAVRVVQRTRTLGSILQNIANVTIVIIALVLVVQLLAPGTLGSLTLLTAAIGAGLGFGAQNIVKDVLNGIFIVAEDQIGIGDIVDVGLATGIVEFVSVRVTHVRDANGTLWYVRNGEITRIGNMSQGWSRAIVDVGVPSGTNITEAESAMLDAANDLAKEPKWHSRILEHPETWGLETISGDLLVIRVVMKTRATAKDDVTSELKLRLKSAVEALGLTVPSLSSVTLTGNDAAQRVRGANPPRTRPTPIATTPDRPLWRTTLPRPEPKVQDVSKEPNE